MGPHDEEGFPSAHVLREQIWTARSKNILVSCEFLIYRRLRFAGGQPVSNRASTSGPLRRGAHKRRRQHNTNGSHVQVCLPFPAQQSCQRFRDKAHHRQALWCTACRTASAGTWTPRCVLPIERRNGSEMWQTTIQMQLRISRSCWMKPCTSMMQSGLKCVPMASLCPPAPARQRRSRPQ